MKLTEIFEKYSDEDRVSRESDFNGIPVCVKYLKAITPEILESSIRWGSYFPKGLIDDVNADDWQLVTEPFKVLTKDNLI